MRTCGLFMSSSVSPTAYTVPKINFRLDLCLYFTHAWLERLRAPKECLVKNRNLKFRIRTLFCVNSPENLLRLAPFPADFDSVCLRGVSVVSVKDYIIQNITTYI